MLFMRVGKIVYKLASDVNEAFKGSGSNKTTDHSANKKKSSQCHLHRRSISTYSKTLDERTRTHKYGTKSQLPNLRPYARSTSETNKNGYSSEHANYQVFHSVHQTKKEMSTQVKLATLVQHTLHTIALDCMATLAVHVIKGIQLLKLGLTLQSSLS